MTPVARFPAAIARRLRGVLFDLDDTLLTHGVLVREAYDALWGLQKDGLDLVAVTGRPSGWGQVLVRQWPVSGFVTENGAVHVVREGTGVSLVDPCDPAERRARRAKLVDLVERVHEVVPEACLTDDNGARRSDVTWDVGERFTLPEERVAAIVREIVHAGARHTRSSVHLHATFDADDKATGAVRFCTRRLGFDPAVALESFAFIGDSGNDAACFSAFKTTFGVSNVRASVGLFSLPPRYVAERAMGAGFAEISAEILRKRHVT